jgi:hypothetical protein
MDGRKVGLLAGGIVLLGAVALAVVLRATGDGPLWDPGPPPAPEAPPPPVPFPKLADLPVGPPEVGPPSPPNVYELPPAPPPEGSWEAIPAAARASTLGPVGAAVGRGLNELKDLVSACFDEDAQARHGLGAVSLTRESQPLLDTGTTVLVLNIETVRGGARIVDAPLETRGGASDGLVSCAQRALRGKMLDAPDAKAGERLRLLYPLLP